MKDIFKPPKDPPILIGRLTPIEPAKLYEGEYEIYPTDEDQILRVKGKRMSFDIIVHPGSDRKVPYEGPYEITPSLVQQVLNTEGKTLSENIVVNPASGEITPEIYDGSYEITPSNKDQVLATAGKLMEQDLVIKKQSTVIPDPYDGEYSIKPDPFEETVLSTSGKVMAQDLHLEPVSKGRYEGPIDIVPSQKGQILQTYGILMTDSLFVAPIPYSEVGNVSGGYTAIIGG